MIWALLILLVAAISLVGILWYKLKHKNNLQGDSPQQAAQNELDNLAVQRDMLLANIEDLKRVQKDLRDSNSAASTLVEDRLRQAEISYQKLAKLEERYEILLPLVEQLQTTEDTTKQQLSMLMDTLTELQQRSKTAILKVRAETSNQGGNKLELEDYEVLEIAALEKVIPMLRNPLALNKAIYEIYFRQRMKRLRELLQVDGKTGVYRVWVNDAATGTPHCYVGQAVDIGDRWNTHLKRLVGAEEGTKVAFYRDAKKYLTELNWEVLEECDRGKLNEVEHYWIEYYGGVSDWNSKS